MNFFSFQVTEADSLEFWCGWTGSFVHTLHRYTRYVYISGEYEYQKFSFTRWLSMRYLTWSFYSNCCHWINFFGRVQTSHQWHTFLAGVSFNLTIFLQHCTVKVRLILPKLKELYTVHFKCFVSIFQALFRWVSFRSVPFIFKTALKSLNGHIADWSQQ